MSRKKLSKYERECSDNLNLLHSLVFTMNYKHGYFEKLLPLSYSDTFTDKDFIATVYGIAWAHGIDITRLDLSGFRQSVQDFQLADY